MPFYSAARYVEGFPASSSHAKSSKVALDNPGPHPPTWSFNMPGFVNPTYEQKDL
ncbi:hypothetical protein EVJ58_g11006, partial [Rhodofomes roseus]